MIRTAKDGSFGSWHPTTPDNDRCTLAVRGFSEGRRHLILLTGISRRCHQRLVSTSVDSPMGHVLLSWDPECCHGNTSVTAGHSGNVPVSAG